MCEVYKIINEIGPIYLQKLYTQKKTPYESRAAVPVVVPKFRTIKFGKRSLSSGAMRVLVCGIE